MLEPIRRSPLGPAILATVVVIAVAACSLAGAATGVAPTPSPVVAASLPVTTQSPATSPSGSVAAGSVAAGPPIAALAAEGGDPTDGQLGTYTWGDGGSDAPWLPGAPMAVGSGEPLTVSFRPETTIETWSARAVPSTADGPADATVLGQGSGEPRFAALGSGTWTVEVHVVFANAAGQASYFWQLAVD
jgi:hypothetical protein